jgi:hypothetical protein
MPVASLLNTGLKRLEALYGSAPQEWPWQFALNQRKEGDFPTW